MSINGRFIFILLHRCHAKCVSSFSFGRSTLNFNKFSVYVFGRYTANNCVVSKTRFCNVPFNSVRCFTKSNTISLVFYIHIFFFKPNKKISEFIFIHHHILCDKRCHLKLVNQNGIKTKAILISSVWVRIPIRDTCVLKQDT